MVNSILTYSEEQLKTLMPFLERVDAPVYRLNNGQIFKGLGSEKQEVCISDMVGKAVYIRPLGNAEQIRQEKPLTSCDRDYTFVQRCKAVFYSFANEHDIVQDKIKTRLVSSLRSLSFRQYTGSGDSIDISVVSASTDIEKIFLDETGKKYEGSQWPILVAVEFLLSYMDNTCDECDIEVDPCVIS